MSNKPTLTFCSGVSTVTGANFLLEIPIRSGTKKILIDCGLEQGSRFADESNRLDFPYDPSSIDILLVTHAHIDHVGRIPKLVKDGFAGRICSTPATLDLAKLMLADTLNLLQMEAQRDGVLPLYERAHVDQAFKLWEIMEYYQSFNLGDGVMVNPKDSGHILGSAMLEITIGKGKIVFTGDLGNSPSPFLRDTDALLDTKYLVMESVYGDRNHESKEERKQKLTHHIKDTIQRNRTLIIPAFSLERTQDILYEINDLVERDQIKPVKVYIDSPLATHVTQVYKKYKTDFNEGAKDLIAQGDDLFDFPKLKFTVQREESDKILSAPNPKIIIAGSGMSNGGRIIKHEKHFLPDKNTTLLFVGYQSVGTLGRQILDGAKKVIIDGQEVVVRAQVERILGYSSHKDSDHLIEFVEKVAEPGLLKKAFVVMGEPKAALFLVQRLRDYLGVDAIHPEGGSKVELDL